jgi:cell division protease FtsH
MSPKVGPLNYTQSSEGVMFQEKPYSEATAQLIDDEMRRIVEECQDEAQKTLEQHRGQLDTLAQSLLKNDSLDEADILKVTGLPPAPATSTAKSTTGQQAAATSATSRP